MYSFVEQSRRQIHSNILTTDQAKELAKEVVTNIKAKLAEMGTPIPNTDDEEEEEEEEEEDEEEDNEEQRSQQSVIQTPRTQQPPPKQRQQKQQQQYEEEEVIHMDSDSDDQSEAQTMSGIILNF